MGFLKMIFQEPPQAVKLDLTVDLTAMYPPLRPTKPLPKPVAFPPELVLSILEAAYLDQRLEPDYSVLRACALVCADWREAAQRLLFRHVVLRTQSAYVAFAQAVNQESVRASMLLESVVRLNATVDLAHPDGMTMDSLVQTLSLVPNLYELSLSLFGTGTRSASSLPGQIDPADLNRDFPSLPAPLLSALKLARPRSLTALTLSNWSDNTTITIQLLSLFGSRISRSSTSGPLRFLTLRGATPPDAPSRSRFTFASALTGLRLSFQGTPSTAFTSWLLDSSPALESLELERDPHPELLAHLVALQPNLHSLALPTCTIQTRASLAALTGLRELRLEDAWISPAVLRAIPLGQLEHLALGVGRETPLLVVRDLLAKAPNLQAVTAMLWDEKENPFLEEMRTGLAHRGAMWRSVRDVQVFRSVVRGDPLPTEHYPRTKDVDNLQHMRAIGFALPSDEEDDACSSAFTSRSASPVWSAAHSRENSLQHRLQLEHKLASASLFA